VTGHRLRAKDACSWSGYVDAGRVCFGELTFTPLGGVVPITPRGYDAWLGAFWTLPRGAAPRRRRTG
jgi:hypothetical protein